MVACPACGTANPDGFRFCGACATPLPGPSAAVEPQPAASGERKVITALFCDLVGSTELAERLDPEDVDRLLRSYHGLARQRIESHGGTLEKFIGDAVVGIFGAPAAHEDDPERAVRAALRIVEDLAGSDLGVHVRIGVNTGEALVRVGTDPASGEGLATGDCLNTAARLQASAPVDGIVVGEATWRATARDVAYQPLEPVFAKGKAEPLALWRATGTIARPTGELISEATPFVGRAFELESLVRLFDRSRATPTLEVVTIVADPGIGKSRLVRELARHVEGLPELVTWRAGRCLPYGEGISFWALGEIVKAHAGILDTDDQATVGTKLDTVLTEPDPSRRAWMKDRIGPLVGLQVTTEPPQQEEAFTAWRRFLESLAATRPTVLVVEDLHWADDALVAFLQHVGANTAGLPLLLVVTARPEVEDRHPTWLGRARRSSVLSLATLPDQDVSALVAATLPVASPALIATILDRAAGSPLYAEQIAAMLRDRPPIVGGSLDEEAVPPSIQALLAARIDALPAEHKTVLLDASVVGKTFWSGTVAALGGRERGVIEPLLAELARRELVRPVFPSSMAGEAEYTFWHALLRDVAYGELPRTARMARHRTAAAWITERAGAALGEDAEIVVAHLEQTLELATATRATGDIPAIRVDLVKALLESAAFASRFDVPRATVRLRRALDLIDPNDPQRPSILARLGRNLLGEDSYEEARTALEEARTSYLVAGREVEAASLWIPLTVAFRQTGDLGAALRIFETSDEVLRTHGGLPLVDHLAFAARMAVIGGRRDEAVRLADEALALAEALGAPVPYHALRASGSVRLDEGDRGGEADLRRAAALASGAGDPRTAEAVFDNLANQLIDYSVPAALAAAEERVAFRRAHGFAATQTTASIPAASLLGRWDELLEDLPALTAYHAACGDVWTVFHIKREQVLILLERGDVEVDPVALAEEARSLGGAQELQTMLPVAARLANAQGRRGLGVALLEELAEALHSSDLWAIEPIRAAAEVGRPDLARRFLDQVTPACRRSGLADAIVAEAEGDIPAARTWYATAVTMCEEIGNVPDGAYALAGLGRCLLALGETEEGIARLRESRGIWERLRATPRIEEIDAALAAAGVPTEPAPGADPAAGARRVADPAAP